MDSKSKNKAAQKRLGAYSERIRGLREDNDLTQTQVADIIHVGQKTYSDYERENLRIPVESLIKLAKYYDVDMNYICGVTNQKRPFPKTAAKTAAKVKNG